MLGTRDENVISSSSEASIKKSTFVVVFRRESFKAIVHLFSSLPILLSSFARIHLPVMATMHGLDWLFAIGTIFFLISAWGIGANDVANSYATSVSAKSLTMVQAGCLAVITEFIGAIALGQQVTSTIRSGVFQIEPFENSPGVLIMANVIAEIGEFNFHCSDGLGLTNRSLQVLLLGLPSALRWDFQYQPLNPSSEPWLVSASHLTLQSTGDGSRTPSLRLLHPGESRLASQPDSARSS